MTNISWYYWDYSKGGSSSSGWTVRNNWRESRLNTINLNTNFLNNIGSYWESKIAETTWYIGGGKDENFYNNAQTAYNYELGANKIDSTYLAKIGLMYVSEYYYSASPENWIKPGNYYDDTKDYSTAISQNWMFMGLEDFTISRHADSRYRPEEVYAIKTDGSIGRDTAYLVNHVRPSFRLVPEIELAAGSGSKSDPFRIR